MPIWSRKINPAPIRLAVMKIAGVDSMITSKVKRFGKNSNLSVVEVQAAPERIYGFYTIGG
jgi:hypothetical protein